MNKNKKIVDNFYFNTLLILLLILVFSYTKSIILIPILISYLIYYLFTYKILILVLPLIMSIAFVLNTNEKVIVEDEWAHHVAVVDEVYNTSITVKEDGERYYIMKVDENLVKGDVIEYNTPYYTKVEKGSFDLFYRSTKSIAYGYANDLNIIQKNSSYRSEIHNSLYAESSYYSDITLMMLYGEEKGKGIGLKDKVNKMGIPHLFVVSGFHISLFIVFIEWLFSKATSNETLITTLSISCSALFLYFIYFPPTGIRALLTIGIYRCTNKDKINSLSIVGIIFFITNPWMMLSASMILSFSITYAIYFYNPKTNSIIDMLALSLFAFYISLPTISTWEDKHNLFAPLLSMVLTPIVSFYYVLALIALPLQFLWVFMEIPFKLFYLLIDIFSMIQLTFETEVINMARQFTLIGISLYFVSVMKENKLSLILTFFSISLLIFLI